MRHPSPAIGPTFIADIVMTGGGPGKDAPPFSFTRQDILNRI
ncbi:hypothetical protein [Janthinobacterium lividum]